MRPSCVDRPVALPAEMLACLSCTFTSVRDPLSVDTAGFYRMNWEAVPHLILRRSIPTLELSS